jgi:hypothetical protein
MGTKSRHCENVENYESALRSAPMNTGRRFSSGKELNVVANENFRMLIIYLAINLNY